MSNNDTPVSTSRINLAVEAVMNLIDALNIYASIYRGALGTGNGICCEIGPTSPEAIYLDKYQYIPIDLTINGKHNDLRTLSDAMNLIHESLTMALSYPSGNGWEITDITTATEPQVIAREDSGQWIMASALYVKIETRPPVPEPEPEPELEPEPEPENGQE